MTYYANLDRDLPTPFQRKRVIFYQQGLKIYGLLPYILQRKLKAQFFSGSFSCMGGIISMGSFESNWTAIAYEHVRSHLPALLDWLSADRGFEVAIASREDWDDDIFSANVFRYPPETWYPVDGERKSGFLQIAEKPDIARNDVMRLLALPTGKEERSQMTTFISEQVIHRFYVAGYEFGQAGGLPVVRIGANEWVKESDFRANEDTLSKQAKQAKYADESDGEI